MVVFSRSARKRDRLFCVLPPRSPPVADAFAGIRFLALLDAAGVLRRGQERADRRLLVGCAVETKQRHLLREGSGAGVDEWLLKATSLTARGYLLGDSLICGGCLRLSCCLRTFGGLVRAGDTTED
ncbi:hypothetical protein [Sphingomonas sp. R86520]|uniref:hypothetical protein n=1 Tax=Sphingomonas sp. R86520 TaxID=3093859 RepID=UPI0036D4113E